MVYHIGVGSVRCSFDGTGQMREPRRWNDNERFTLFLCFHTPLVKRQYWQKSPEGQGCAQELMQIRLSLRTKKLPWAAHVLGTSVFFRRQKNYRKIENNPCLPRKFHTFAADY